MGKLIFPCGSSPDEQLALVGDHTECLQELSRPLKASNGTEVSDCLRFFCGNKPTQQFERGTQIGGTYKCQGCGCRDAMMIDAHAFYHTLSDRRYLVLL